MTIATLEQLQGKRKQKRVIPLLPLFEDLSYLSEEFAHAVRLLRKVVPDDASDESVLQFVHDNDCVLLTCNRDEFLQLGKHKPHHGITVVVRRRTRASERAALFRLLDSAGRSWPQGQHQLRFDACSVDESLRYRGTSLVVAD